MNPLPGVAEIDSATRYGYASREYAESLAEFGTVQELPGCRGTLLVRPIPSSSLFDGMGCYPLFCCQDWDALRDDLEPLAERLVCVGLVTDPFASADHSQLQATFPSICYEYKQHFVTDLSVPLERIVRGNHLRNARKALGMLEVDRSSSGNELLPAWQALYNNLVERHGITGIAQFSPASFEQQVRVPGFTAFSARNDHGVCGITFWYVQGDVAYYHLAAYSDRGYELGASFALFWNALTYFASIGVRWAALGAGAGTTSAESGLTRFKQGWSTETRPVFFCGRILQPAKYQHLSAKAPGNSTFFPAYRRA